MAGDTCHMCRQCRHHEPGEHEALESGHRDAPPQNMTMDHMSLWQNGNFELGLLRDKTCLVSGSPSSQPQPPSAFVFPLISTNLGVEAGGLNFPGEPL